MTKVHSAVLLLITACLSSAIAGPVMADQQFTPTQTVNYWFALARGGLQGYEQGLYKYTNYVVNETCLGPDAV